VVVIVVLAVTENVAQAVAKNLALAVANNVASPSPERG
jgi:hypothetical protein